MSIEIKNMVDIPANSNPLNHDHTRMATDINERFTAMYTSRDSNELVIIDKLTGKRVKLQFPTPELKKTYRPSTSKGRTWCSWVDIKA